MASKQIKDLLEKSRMTQVELAEYFGISRQSMSNKMSRNSWSAADLCKVAHATGCKVGFILNNGETIIIDEEK